jgi:predicted secreted protein
MEKERVLTVAILIAILSLTVIVAGCTSSSTNTPATVPVQTSANASLTTTANVNASTSSITSENTSMTKIANSSATPAEPIRVAQEGSFTITLQSNPSTGYYWDPHFDPAMLSLTNSSFISNPNPYNLVGVPGSQVFTFQSLTSGTTTITFDNVSPSGTVTEQVTYTVTVT